MIAAIDTNVLAYAEGVNQSLHQEEARVLLGSARSSAVVSPIVLAELFYVLTRKGKRTPTQARDVVLEWSRLIPVLPQLEQWLASAADLATSHRLSIWDAAILDGAADAGCSLLLSEDMQHGFRWRGVTVVDPFAHPEHPLLTKLCEQN